MLSRKHSRPSSAASHSSSRSASDSEFRLDCKAAFLSIYDDIRDVIQSDHDLLAVLQQSGRNPTNKTLMKHWSHDTEYLTFDDFTAICRREPVTSADDLIKAFKRIDINGDGYISLDELFRMLTTRGDKMTREEVRQMIDEVDENRDGKLDYGEFCNMLMSTADECKKMSMRVMEKKERRKKRPGTGERAVTPRRADEEYRGSRTSLRSNVSGRPDSRVPSHSSLRSDDLPRPSPRARKDKSQPAVSGRNTRLPEPSNLREWTHTSSKGCFFVDSDEDGKIVCHQYLLHVPDDCRVYITMQPLKIGDAGTADDCPVDTSVYVLREGSSHVDRVITFAENRDSKGKYCARCELSAGKYRLIPFTSGCRLKERHGREPKEAKLIKKDKDDKIALTKAFKKALEDIFDMVDLDGNGYLSREEFNWFNNRTSGENVADDEWEVVEGNIELHEGEITKTGFVHLNQMEAEDNDGDADDLWVTLSSMGFNKGLVIDQACPFKLDVYTEDCDDADLKVQGLEVMETSIEEAVCESVVAKGEVSKVKGLRDVNVYTYIGDARASVVVENKSHSRVKLELDCSRSKNVISNCGDLTHMVTVPSNTTMIGMHLLPRDEKSEWIVRCHGQEAVR